MAAAIPGARFVPLESRNHLILEDEPAFGRLLDELKSFLKPDVSAPLFVRSGGLGACRGQCRGASLHHHMNAWIGVTNSGWLTERGDRTALRSRSLHDFAKRFGKNYSMVVPMLSEERAIGSIFVARTFVSMIRIARHSRHTPT